MLLLLSVIFFLRYIVQTHPKILYLLVVSFCLLSFVFCFSSSNTVSIFHFLLYLLSFSASLRHFRLLFVAHPIIFPSSVLSIFSHKKVETGTLYHTHHLSLSALFCALHTSSQYTANIHTETHPSPLMFTLSQSPAGWPVRSSQGRLGDMMKSPAENIYPASLIPFLGPYVCLSVLCMCLRLHYEVINRSRAIRAG